MLNPRTVNWDVDVWNYVAYLIKMCVSFLNECDLFGYTPAGKHPEEKGGPHVSLVWTVCVPSALSNRCSFPHNDRWHSHRSIFCDWLKGFLRDIEKVNVELCRLDGNNRDKCRSRLDFITSCFLRGHFPSLAVGLGRKERGVDVFFCWWGGLGVDTTVHHHIYFPPCSWWPRTIACISRRLTSGHFWAASEHPQQMRMLSALSSRFW